MEMLIVIIAINEINLTDRELNRSVFIFIM